MAALKIPDPVVEGLAIVAKLNLDSYQELMAALHQIPLKIKPNRIFDDSNFKLEAISEDDVRLIRDAVVSLYVARANNEVPVSEFANDIVEALKRTKVEWAATEESHSKIRERLTEVLGVETLGLVAMASDVIMQHAQTYNSARVTSDIRPVFGKKTPERAEAAVIVHMLTIGYFRAGKRHEFVVALDTKDVKDLAEILKQAEEKTKSLESIVSSTKMPYVEVG